MSQQAHGTTPPKSWPLVLGAIGVFIIERQFVKAAAFALAGAVLTFFGFMHSEAIGLAQSPTVAFGYLVVAGMLYGCARLTMSASQTAPLSDHGLEQPAL